jgi:hypothetical protein
MSEANATGLEPIIEALKERAVAAAGKKTPEGAREAQFCGFIAEYLAALNVPSQETPALEAVKAFAEFRRSLGRDLTMQDVLAHLEGLPPGIGLEEMIQAGIERPSV